LKENDKLSTTERLYVVLELLETDSDEVFSTIKDHVLPIIMVCIHAFLVWF